MYVEATLSHLTLLPVALPCPIRILKWGYSPSGKWVKYENHNLNYSRWNQEIGCTPKSKEFYEHSKFQLSDLGIVLGRQNWNVTVSKLKHNQLYFTPSGVASCK